jgi:hypothetical protein
MSRFRLRVFALLAAAVVAAGGTAAYLLWPARGDPRLRAFVHANPPVPVVFTSRTEPASLIAAADEGEGFAYPGQGLWQAREGRLRLLKPNGSVHELTWGKKLPDGSTLIDVMSPSVSIDGERIYFAGRKAPPDPGRFRLYVINVDGSGLRQLTGGPDDPGCTALPPMRWRSESDHTLIPDDERKRIDYDDVDPVELHYQQTPRLAFASSRTPDFGRNSTRRSTNIWELRLDTGAKRPLTANRANDRWPFLLSDNFVAFSLWSRNQEVIAPDERDIVPWEPGMKSPRPPCDMWLGAFLQPTGQFGGLLKARTPVWRPRPLSNGRIVFQTNLSYWALADLVRDTCMGDVVQADPGLLLNSPSAATDDDRPSDSLVQTGPALGPDGESLRLATPSPCPGNHVLLAAIPVPVGNRGAHDYGVWLCRDDWDASATSGNTADMRLLFDDPDFVDAEPVAVYARRFDRWMDATESPPLGEPPQITFADGRKYEGPSGTVFGSSLYVSQHADAPGQLFPNRDRPFFVAPPKGELDHIRVYASHRDRFDDPVKPRVNGKWELLLKVPVKNETFGAQVPAGVPFVLAGFDRSGRVLSWTNDPPPPAREGVPTPPQTRIFAFAGDHYSAARLGGKHFCVGCHPGHSGLGRDDHRHAERER